MLNSGRDGVVLRAEPSRALRSVSHWKVQALVFLQGGNVDSAALLTAVSRAASKISKVQAEYFINLLFRNIGMIFRISKFLGS